MGRSEIDSEIARGVIRRTVDLCNGGGGVSVHKSKGKSAQELHKITAKLLKGLPRGNWWRIELIARGGGCLVLAGARQWRREEAARVR